MNHFGIQKVWLGMWIGFRLIVVLLIGWGLCGCLTTLSLGTAARSSEAHRTRGALDNSLAPDIPTPQWLNFGVTLPKLEVYE